MACIKFIFFCGEILILWAFELPNTVLLRDSEAAEKALDWGMRPGLSGDSFAI